MKALFVTLKYLFEVLIASDTQSDPEFIEVLISIQEIFMYKRL